MPLMIFQTMQKQQNPYKTMVACFCHAVVTVEEQKTNLQIYRTTQVHDIKVHGTSKT